MRRRRLGGIATALVLALVATACGHGRGRATSGGDDPVVWRAAGRHGIDGLAVDGDLLVVATPFTLIGASAQDGRRRWALEHDEEGPPTFSFDGDSVVYDDFHTERTIDRQSGKVTAQRDSPRSAGYVPPTAHGRLTDLGLAWDIDEGDLVLCDARTKAAAWRLDGHEVSSAEVAGDALYVQSELTFYALDPRTGAVRWTVSSGGNRNFDASPDFPRGGNRVFFGLADGTLWSVRTDQPDAAVRDAIAKVSKGAARTPPKPPAAADTGPAPKPLTTLPAGIPEPAGATRARFLSFDGGQSTTLNWEFRGDPAPAAAAYVRALQGSGFSITETPKPNADAVFVYAADVSSPSFTGQVDVRLPRAECSDPPATVSLTLIRR